MATRREVKVRSGNVGEAQRAKNEAPEPTAMVAPETLQERQNAVRKTRRPAGPLKAQTGGAAALGEASSDAKPTLIEDLNLRS